MFRPHHPPTHACTPTRDFMHRDFATQPALQLQSNTFWHSSSVRHHWTSGVELCVVSIAMDTYGPSHGEQCVLPLPVQRICMACENLRV